MSEQPILKRKLAQFRPREMNSILLSNAFMNKPSPVPSCHASTIAEAADGTLVAAWFGGTKEKHPDVCIYLQRYENGKWKRPENVADGIQNSELRYPCWNPVLFRAANGPLMLFYKVGPNCSDWWGEIKESSDAGKTWSAARKLPEGFLGPAKNKPVQLENGDILCPSSTELPEWTIHMERTSDLGKTWTKTDHLNDDAIIPAIQPSLLVHDQQHIQAIGRTWRKRIFTIESMDGGVTWGQMSLLDLPNPSSGVDAVKLTDGRFLLIYNHSETSRSALNLAISEDGKNWKSIGVLEDKKGEEYSYPAIIQTSDGMVHATYTWQRKYIKHVVINPMTVPF